MNIVDKKFNELVNKIKNMTTDEIFVNIQNGFHHIHPDTKKSLENYFNKFGYWGALDITNNNYAELYYKAQTLNEHINDFIWLYNKLNDYTSKKILFAILNNWYQYDFSTLKECMNNPFKHYFDLDLIPNSDFEVFVDLGAYTGDTALDFINTYNNYKKIYCYEITKETTAILKNTLSNFDNIVYKNKAVLDKNQILYLKESSINASANQVGEIGTTEVEAVTLDDDVLERIDILKMDIEGSEYQALLGAKNHIKNDTPKLLISVYHNNDDLWRIPILIEEYNKDYNYYLRYYGNNVYPTEIVLICIPKPRKY
mgnify:FL=1